MPDDAKTDSLITDLSFSWDLLHRSRYDNIVIPGSLGPFAESVEVKPAGVLMILGLRDPDQGVETSSTSYAAGLRCRVTRDSKYAAMYRVKVGGLDVNGHLTAKPGDDVNLNCTVLASETGEIVKEGVIYHWDLRTAQGDSFIMGKLVKNEVITNKAQLTLLGLRDLSSGPAAIGRCLAEVPRSATDPGFTYASPSFNILVPPPGTDSSVIGEPPEDFQMPKMASGKLFLGVSFKAYYHIMAHIN
ncbi:unnamed protein product [Protopolystoma xenopodis]|uniref:Uncharacterized protein n=1 Tax=Protopolystoma xenopodis TaxID=117903 RepID=A0A448WFM1_9PLAT|nr:unnamed protein product [Protopolystoma xenopodis]